MKHRVSTLEEIEKVAAEYASRLTPAKGHATLLALRGDLGAGKTTFTRALARAYGIEEDVTSPTFVIAKIYESDHTSFKRLVHIDAYRLKGPHDLEVLGWRELLQDETNLIILEWPEKVEGALPEHVHEILCTFVDEGTRTIEYE